MDHEEQGDIRNLPSWKYMGWGILNGLFLGILIKHHVDISETGIYSQILNAFKPLFESAHLSTGMITFLLILLGVIGITSTAAEVFAIYEKGWPARIIAICGLLSILLIILNIITNIAVILLIVGCILVISFPDE